jgi:putative membrane protein
MFKMLTAATVISVAALGTAWAESAEQFVSKAANSGMFEVQSSQLALEHAKQESVRNFAQQMISDHSKANEELKKVAGQEGIQVPSELDASHRDKLAELRDEDEEFDEAYIEMQVEGHDDAVDLFEDYASDGDNAALKQFAEKTLPTLKKHKEEVTALAEN